MFAPLADEQQKPNRADDELYPRTFASLPDVLSRAKCPHCGAEHIWWTREAWLAADGGVDARTLIVRHRSVKKAS